jgi:16S rRNA (adenine1518-N6/adenine1519-N6)-dimethyltransferase
LVDPAVAQRSVALVDLRPGEVVVEVGAGLGALTQYLLATGSHVYAVEIDRRLFDSLQARWGQENRLHLICDDAVRFPLAGLPPSTTDYKVVANLPYSIASVWLDRLLECTHLPKIMALMVQREVAERWTAAFGTKQFSPLGIFLQSAFENTHFVPIAKKMFYPQPRVDPCLVVLVRRRQAFQFPQMFKSFLRALFTRRRQQVGRLCRERKDRPEYAFLANFLLHNNFPGPIRAEDLPTTFWQECCTQFTASYP